MLYIIIIDPALAYIFHRVVSEQDVLGGFRRLFLVVNSQVQTLQFLRVGELVRLLFSLLWWSCHDPSGPSDDSAHLMEVWTVSSLHNCFATFRGLEDPLLRGVLMLLVVPKSVVLVHEKLLISCDIGCVA